MKLTTQDIAVAAIEAAYETLAQNGLEHEASALAADMERELQSRHGAVTATLVTPSGSSGAFAESVKATLEKKLGRSVKLTERADKNLLGGAILEFGDERIDLSVRGALENARMQLTRSEQQ
jgi:F0F1-type ATP synthase delta subunit